MKKWFNLLFGYGVLQITGAFPERFFNLCAQYRRGFWHLRWLDAHTVQVRVHLADLSELEELAQRCGCTLEVLSRRGGLAQLQRLSKRWGFMLGLGLCLLAVSVLSRFVLVVEVVGNETVPSAVILTQLERLGVRPGAYAPSISQREVANEALTALPELSFMAINVYGTRVVVQVEEAEEKPELLDQSTPADIVATADGIIEDIQTSAGQAQFVDGDIVAKGEVLISGTIPLYEQNIDKPYAGDLVVHATGTVTARTWRTLEERLPLTVPTKVWGEEKKTSYRLTIGGMKLDFFKNSSIFPEGYGKITSTEYLELGGYTWPVSWTTTTYRNYTVEQQAVDPQLGEELLKQLLEQRLERLLEEGQGEILRQDYVTRVEGDTLVVTLAAECREQIGRTVERPGETGHTEPETQDGEES
ncbi:sporulation protein YqfD [Pseudoflavonifractor capillosus]|uniref:sporulation protein YqfD n=1 Tax=Pseudoflavonifractor capillosus TaxID=106588 RepID=UPI00195D4541|nr:sporulation protein YqfD [Pseudoflavonifractor capillosus]MBM6896146.1 sporulation protein YqfD [Pseudoflavonifractor capillosus]